MSHKVKPFRPQNYHLLVSQLAAAKQQARNLTMHCMAEETDSVTKSRASNIIALLHDAEEQLEKIAEVFKWEQM